MTAESQDRHETFVTLTSDVVAAFVSNNTVSTSELGGLIANVYSAIAGLGGKAPAEDAPALTPAVSVRASIKDDHLVCLDCGAKMKMLKRHLSTNHDLTTDEYRARWNLKADYPLVAPAYAEKRRDLAVKIGLGRKPGIARGRKPKAK